MSDLEELQQNFTIQKRDDTDLLLRSVGIDEQKEKIVV